MEELNIITIPAVTLIVGCIVQIIKQIWNNEKLNKLLPLISGGLGIVLGIIMFYAGFMPAQNIFAAILIGGASGFAATGAHQIVKQLGNGKDKTDAEPKQQNEENNTGSENKEQ